MISFFCCKRRHVHEQAATQMGNVRFAGAKQIGNDLFTIEHMFGIIAGEEGGKG